MARRSVRRLSAAAALSVVLLGAAFVAHAGSRFYLTGYVPASGYPAECAQSNEGYWSPNVFAGSYAKIDWGGTCNQANGRPAGWLTVHLTQYNGSTLVGWSGPWGNAAGSDNAFASQAKESSANAVCSEARYWKSNPGSWASATYCSNV